MVRPVDLRTRISLIRPCQPVQVRSHDQAVHEVERLLQAHSMVFISGTSHNNYRGNLAIGKTEMFYSPQWRSYLSLGGLTAYHHNPHHRMVHDIDVSRIPDADIYIFDEIHHFVPDFKERYETKNRNLLPFWGKVRTLLDAGKKVVFISAIHPMDPFYLYLLSPQPTQFTSIENIEHEMKLYEDAGLLDVLLRLFECPVVELPAKKA